jgi:hypothetical protein
MATAIYNLIAIKPKLDRFGAVAIVQDQVTLDRIREVMRELQLDDELSFVATLDVAIRHIHDGQRPRVLIIDVSDSPAPISDLSAARAVGGADMKVVALGSLNDVELYRNLIAVGATDYLVKPPSHEALSALFEQHSFGADGASGLGRVVAFIGSRGGVGCTAAAVSCATAPKSHRNAEADFNFPLTTVFGVSYRPTPKWNLEVDANYTGWNSFDSTAIQQSPPPVNNPFHQDIPVHLDWQASWMYEFGVTRYFDNGWHVSGGYVFNENSVPDKFYTPLAADMDRHFFSIGAGYNGKTFDFDLAYQFGYGPEHTVTGSTPSSTPGQFAGQTADGKYGFTSSALIVSVGMHF